MITTAPVKQRSYALPNFNRADMSDQNRMGIVVECGFELAVQDRQGIFKDRRTGLEAIPSGVAVAFGALSPVKSGKGLRHLLLVGSEHVDTKAAVLLQRRP